MYSFWVKGENSPKRLVVLLRNPSSQKHEAHEITSQNRRQMIDYDVGDEQSLPVSQPLEERAICVPHEAFGECEEAAIEAARVVPIVLGT